MIDAILVIGKHGFAQTADDDSGAAVIAHQTLKALERRGLVDVFTRDVVGLYRRNKTQAAKLNDAGEETLERLGQGAEVAVVVDLADARAKDGWVSGWVLCVSCHWQYVAVRPEGCDDRLECAHCGACRVEAIRHTRSDVVAVYEAPGAPARLEDVEQ